MDSLIVAIDTTRAAVIAVSETLHTTVAVVDTVRTSQVVGQGQGVPQDWTLLAGGALAYIATLVRAKIGIPNIVADGVIVGAGLVLYVVGFEGQIQWSRGFVVGAFLWLSSVRGLSSWFVSSGVAPRLNTI